MTELSVQSPLAAQLVGWLPLSFMDQMCQSEEPEEPEELVAAHLVAAHLSHLIAAHLVAAHLFAAHLILYLDL